MLENLSFTDAQGQTFTDAVVRVSNANISTSTNGQVNETIRLDLNDVAAGLQIDTNEYDNVSIDLNATYVYWSSAASYNAGNQPYLLTFNLDGTYRSDLRLSKSELSKEKYTALNLEEKCELYFTDEILPTLI